MIFEYFGQFRGGACGPHAPPLDPRLKGAIQSAQTFWGHILEFLVNLVRKPPAQIIIKIERSDTVLP